MTPTPPPAGQSADQPTGKVTEKATDKAALKQLLAEPDAVAWYRRPLWWGVAVAVLLAVAGLWYWQARKAANALPSYTTQPVTKGNLTLAVTANGTLQPTRTITIGSEQSGIVRQVMVDVNDRIQKGQVLVVLDTAKLSDQILRSTAALSAANAKVLQTAATVAEATATLARLEEVAQLSGGKVPSKAELDAGRATLARAVADHTSTGTRGADPCSSPNARPRAHAAAHEHVGGVAVWL